MNLFDFALFTGADPKSPSVATADALLHYLNVADAEGLVASLAGAFYDFQAGNAETLALAKTDKRLLPVVTVDPRRVDAADFDFHAAAAEGFRALALFPAIQHWSLSHPAVEEIIKRAGRARLPVVLHVSRAESAAGAKCLALATDVAVIVVGIAYGSVGEVVAAAREVRNLYFGMSLFVGLDNVETLVKRLGATHLVFDSGEPRLSHAPALSLLESAAITDEDRHLIATGNARRIFGGLP